ncbi:MAG: hypothetical protein KC503_32565 [Myxococcales bacterium]|nr:hypothetical protein [Myxococcales bacterium]
MSAPAKSRGIIIAVIVAALVLVVGGVLLLREMLRPKPALRMVYRMTPLAGVKLDERSKQACLARVKARLEQLGVDGAVVTRRGDELDVDVPALEAATMRDVKRVLARGGRLELTFINDAGDPLRALARELGRGGLVEPRPRSYSGRDGRTVRYTALVGRDRAALQRLAHEHARHVAGRLLVGASFEVQRRGAPLYELFLLERETGLTSNDVTSARAIIDDHTGRAQVAMRLGEVGARRFGEMTARNVGRRLAIVVDGHVMSAPVVQSAIRGGRAVIDLGGAARSAVALLHEAKTLAAVLRAGAMPARLQPLSESQLQPK